MRSLVVTVAVLAAAAGTAVADEDQDYAPVPSVSAAIGMQGHGTRIGGRSEGGAGAALEIALGRGRWQYVAETAIGSSGLDRWTTPAAEMRIDGVLIRGGLGVRWIARQFMPQTRGSAIELFLLSMLGVQRFSYDDWGRLTRPELALGFGIQGRVFKRPRLAFRLDVRILFTPSDGEHALASCSRTCMEADSSTGFLTGIAFAW